MILLCIKTLLAVCLLSVGHSSMDFDRFEKHVDQFPRYLEFRNGVIEKVRQKDLSFLNLKSLEQASDAVYYVWLNGIPGDISEFGVYRGGTSIVMASVLFFLDPDTTRKCHLFDSFEGHPDYKATAEKDFDLTEWGGKVIAPIEGVIQALSEFGLQRQFEAHRIVLHKGWFKDTAPNLMRQLSVIRADGDAYTSTMDTLANAYKKLEMGGMVIVDDYGTYKSCDNAVHDFFKAENISMSEMRFPPGSGGTNAKMFWTKTH